MSELPGPDWYPDPVDPDRKVRWWDGGRWTDRTEGRPPVPGWYADPGEPERGLRWWDGIRWTGHAARRPDTG